MSKASMSRLLVSLLVVSIMLSSTPVVFAQSELAEHWARTAMERWNERGILMGYPDGTLRPDGLITRAEFTALLNRTFGFIEAAPTEFSDVGGTDWFKADFEKALAAGYMNGYPDGTVKPNNYITRQEASVVLARILSLSQDAEAYSFADYESIPEWSRWAVMACARRGLVVGYPDNSFGPERNMTRAETVTILDRVFAEVYSAPGIYGTDAPTEVDGSVVVTATGVTLQNLTIKGDLLIAQAVGDGEVTLKNVVVRGKTQVSGGGANSVVVFDSSLRTVEVDKEGVTVRVQGKTVIDLVHLKTGARVEEDGVEGDGVKDVTVDSELPEGTTIVLKGNFNSVQVNAGSITVELEDGQIIELVTGTDARDLNIVLDSRSSVGTLTLNAPADVSGTGTIDEAEINVAGCTIEQKPDKVTLPPGVTAIVDGKTVGAPTGGGGGSVTPPAVVTGVAVKTAPTKTTYTAGEALDLSGLVVTLTKSDSSTEDVAFDDFGSKGITTDPVNGTMLATTNTVVTITVNGKSTTQTITVNPAPPTLVSGSWMAADPNKVGAGYVVVEGDGQVKITLPTVLEKAGYGVTEGRLNLGGKDFNYTEADGTPSWTTPKLAYVPVLVDLAVIGEVESVTYDEDPGAVIALDGKLYVNIPVAENSAATASEATVSDWSLLDPGTTVVVITATDGEKFTLTATTAEQVVEPDK